MRIASLFLLLETGMEKVLPLLSHKESGISSRKRLGSFQEVFPKENLLLAALRSSCRFARVIPT